MVTFRNLDAATIGQHTHAVIRLNELKVWKICILLGIDPRNFALDFVMPPAVEGREQDGEQNLLHHQQMVIDAYSHVGVTSFTFGDHLDVEAKRYMTDHTMEILENLVVQRCSALGVFAGDISRGWTAPDDEYRPKSDYAELEEYVERLYLAYDILDGLPS
jgi:hypothetical protein